MPVRHAGGLDSCIHQFGYILGAVRKRKKQVMLYDHRDMKSRMEPKAGRGGMALLEGLLRCRRCGRMLHVAIAGRTRGAALQLPRSNINHGQATGEFIGGLLIAGPGYWAEILKLWKAMRIEAALGLRARLWHDSNGQYPPCALTGNRNRRNLRSAFGRSVV